MGAASNAVKDATEGSKSGRETVISSTDALESFGDLLDRAWVGERLQITKYGKDRAFLLGPKDYERFLELEREAKRGKR